MALSRSLEICALRLGFTGRGAGGMLGGSRLIRARCSWFSSSSSVLIAAVWEGVWADECGSESALVAGSMCNGYWL